MEILRLAVVSIVFGGLAIFLGKVVILGLLSGRIAHSDSESFVDRSTNPVGFWLLVVLFSSFIAMCIFCLGKSLL